MGNLLGIVVGFFIDGILEGKALGDENVGIFVGHCVGFDGTFVGMLLVGNAVGLREGKLLVGL